MAAMEKRMAKAFGLEGDAWQRHANPWSVYTRIPVPAALVAAIWTYAWIGWWSLVPVGVVCLWLAVNPKVFRPPRSLDHWASRRRCWARRSGPTARRSPCRPGTASLPTS